MPEQNAEGEVYLLTKKTFTLVNQHLKSTKTINFISPERENRWVAWFVNVKVQWSHLEPLQFMLWFLAISSAPWFGTDSEVPSCWESWVTPGCWCESLFGPQSSTSDVCDKSLQANILVDPLSAGRSPLVRVRLLKSSWGFNNEERHSLPSKIITSLKLFYLSEL